MRIGHYEPPNGIVTREWESFHISATTSEGPLEVTVVQQADGDIKLNIETGPDQDGHGMVIWMDGVQVDFQVIG
jgi:hypothetical protein